MKLHRIITFIDASAQQQLKWATVPDQSGAKSGGGCCAAFRGGAGSLTNPTSPGPRPTCVPSGILVNPSSRLATIDIDRKVGAAVPLS